MTRGRRAGVEGSIRQLKSGNWQARFPASLDPSTRPIPGGPFPTRTEAELALIVAVRRVRAGTLVLEPVQRPIQPPPPPRTVENIIDDFLREHTRLSPKTLQGYRSDKRIICHPEYGIGQTHADSLTTALLVSWRQTLSSKGVSFYTERAVWALLRSALSWEVEQGRRENNPAVGVRMRRTQSNVAAINSEVVRLPSWADAHALAKAIPNDDDRLFYLIAAWSGPRFAEIAAIEPTNVLAATRQIFLVKHWVKPTGENWVTTPLKSGHTRKVPVPQGLFTYLKEYVDGWTAPSAEGRVSVLFTPSVKFTRGGIGVWTPTLWRERVFIPANETIGRSGEDAFRMKDMRAFAASALHDVGATEVECGVLLGHRSSEVTHRHYVRAMESRSADPARSAIRINPSLSIQQRLDAAWDAWVARYGAVF